MLPVSYDPILVVTSVLVAVMASFTSLRLTTGLKALEPASRKPFIAQSAVALGGGIWSMHFVGMLAVELPIGITYDALPTLLSALLAILVTGIGLMLLHFGTRTRLRILLAGTVTGLGIVGMHYLGMQAIRGNCTVGYAGAGVVMATLISIGASVAAFYFAYHRRTLTMIGIGAVMLGLAISAMHYSAMVFTVFRLAPGTATLGEPTISTGILALIVSLAAFLICGLFLLNVLPATLAGDAVTGQVVAEPNGTAFGVAPGRTRSARDVPLSKAFSDAETGNGTAADRPRRIPYERENTIRFFTPNHIWAVQADGHYARVINRDGEHFCPWSLSKVEEVLSSPTFLRTHRSYLVNLDHVAGFKKDGEKAFCLFGEGRTTEVPVSRSQMANVRKALDLA